MLFSTEKPKMAVDMDDTMFPLNELILPLYNEKYNDNLKLEQIRSYNLHEFIKPECTDYWGEFMTDSIIEQMQPVEDSVEVLEELSSVLDLYCVTSGHPYTMSARHDLMSKYHKWYSQSKMYRMPDKSILPFEFMADDYIGHFDGFNGIGILFNKPWNLDYSVSSNSLYRVNTWKELYIMFYKFI